MSNAVSNFTSGLGGVLVGAVLTYFANLRAERIKAQNEVGAKRKNLALSVRLELQACLDSLKQIKGTVDEQNFYPFRWINVLKKHVENLEKLRAEFYLLEDVALQERLFALVTDIDLFVSDVTVLENSWSALNKKKPTDFNGELIEDTSEIKMKDEVERERDIVRERRRLKFGELIDLKRRLEEAIKEVA